MISFDFLQFDQSNLWFFLVSALGLVRERRLLPFVMVAAANLIHGTLAATLVAGLILWQQVDVGTPKWVQLKAALGFLFVFMAAVSPEPFQEFAICFGLLVLSLSFGRGGLGVIPAVILLRQYVPHPQDMEVLLGVGGFYWIAVEGLRLAKLERERLISAVLETICSLGVLFGLKDLFLKFTEDTVMISLGVGFLVFILLIASIVHFKDDAFWKFYRKAKPKISRALTMGDRMISSRIEWIRDSEIEPNLEVEQSFNRLFVLAVVALAVFATFCILSRGGIG